MIDHVNIPVRDLARARVIYGRALAPLGLHVLAEDGPVVGFGRDSWDFGIAETGDAFVPLHLAFAARSRTEVEGFHTAALAAGGRCNGAPGLRDAYGPGYFAGYVIDPEGHRLEAVHRG